MIKPITLAFAIIVSFTVWLVADRTDAHTGVQMQTSFDFNRYPACAPNIQSNCIVAIQFHDAISHQVIATAATTPDMTGRQVIGATVRASSFARRVYAATVYLDNSGRTRQGPRGQTSEYEYRGAN